AASTLFACASVMLAPYSCACAAGIRKQPHSSAADSSLLIMARFLSWVVVDGYAGVRTGFVLHLGAVCHFSQTTPRGRSLQQPGVDIAAALRDALQHLAHRPRVEPARCLQAMALAW